MSGRYTHLVRKLLMSHYQKIVGLGNMGAQYAKTRHNVGMMCMDYMVEKHRAGPYKTKVSYGSDIADLRAMSTAF